MRRIVAALLLCASLGASAQGIEETGLPSMPCQGALAWIGAHPEATREAAARRDAARLLGDPALALELKERAAKDQAARLAWVADRGNRQAQRAVGLIDQDNVKWLYGVVTTKGFPTAAQVGEVGLHHLWLLAQHADAQPRFQAQLLPAFEQRQAAGELSTSDLARLTDRVLKAQGKPQRYGTQFPPEEWAGAHFGLPDDAAVQAVEANRRAIGAMPLADYVCMMRDARKEKW
jgi:hypothetical protein